MGFLKKLFNMSSEQQDNGIYVYIKLARRGEVVQIRINPSGDISHDFSSGERLSRKFVVGPKTYEKAEAILYFNDRNQIVNSEVTGGELVDKEEWLAQQESE